MSKNQNVTKSNAYVFEGSTAVLPEIDRMVAKVMSQKKINVSLEQAREAIEKMYRYIKYFNSLDEEVSIVFHNTDISKVKVLKEFADFIIPSAVRMDPTNLRCKNLIVSEPVAILTEDQTFNNYVDLCDTIRGFFKKDAHSELVPLTDCKKAVNLQSVLNKASCCIDGVYKVNYGSDTFYPIRLISVEEFYETRHFNATESDLVADYLSNYQF